MGTVDTGLLIGLGALILAAATVFYTAYALKHKANGDDVDKQDRRMDRLEAENRELRADLRRCTQENIQLMRELLLKRADD